ncbi:DedA family protein [Okibacterium endophyticum]
MDIITDAILDTVTSPWIYLITFAVAVIDGFFPPVPSETVLVAAVAIGVSTGSPNILLLGVAAAAGAMIGDNIAYALGRALGVTRFRWMRRPRVAAALRWADRGLARRGAMLIFVARYIPVGRIAVNMTAGATRFPRRRFIPLTMIAGASWAAYSVAIGSLAGHWVKDQPLLGAAIGIAIAIVIGLVVDRVITVRQHRADEKVAARFVHPPVDDPLVLAHAGPGADASPSSDSDSDHSRRTSAPGTRGEVDPGAGIQVLR